MVTLKRVNLQALLILLCVVHLSRPVCVEVASDTEAVLGNTMKLTCISCLMREELMPTTIVKWYFWPNESDSTDKILIYHYENGEPQSVDGPFNGRLLWNGSKDLQDLSIWILNVSESDGGLYQCLVQRQFKFGDYRYPACKDKNITLTVKEKASDDSTAIYSEIMMYVLLVFLTLWLLVEMVYCYRKISKADEQAEDTATNYLAVPSEQKDNPVAPVSE